MNKLKELLKTILKPINKLLDTLSIKMQDSFVKSYKNSIDKAKVPFLYRMFGKKYGYQKDELGIPYEDRDQFSENARGTFDFGYTLGKLPYSIYTRLYRTNKIIKDKDLVMIFTYAKSLLSTELAEFKIYASLKDSAALPPYVRIACNDIAIKMNKGISAAQAMQEYYPNLFPQSVIFRLSLAEQSASQEKVYGELKSYYEEKIKRKKQIRKILIYPVIIIFVLLAIILGFNYILLPQYQSSLSNPEDIPNSFKRLAGVAQFITNPVKLVMITIIGVFIKNFLTKTTYGRRLLAIISLSTPGLSNFFILISVQAWFRELDSLINSGLTEAQAVKEASIVVKNELIRSTLEKEYISMIRDSASFADCSNNIPFYSTEVSTLIEIGTETSTVGENIHTINLKVSQSLDDLFDNMSELMTPILIIVVGAIIIALLLPVFNDITNGTNIV